MQKTLGKTPGCKPTLKCALNSCRVLFAKAGMVANRHKMLLGKGQKKPGLRSASWMRRRGTASLWAWTWPPWAANVCSVVTQGSCGPIATSSFWQVAVRLRSLR